MPVSSYVTSQSISASTTSARATHPPGTSRYVEVFNPTAAFAFVNSGTVAVVATTTGGIVGPTSSKVFEHNTEDTHLAVILSTGTGTIYFQPTSTPGQ
jgi:hypothetical protein